MKCDVAIVGAGPAGSLAANILAKRGLDVLLIDKATFPRTKVCGCCVNQWAQAALAQCGLEHVLEQLGARAVHSVTFAEGGRRATIRVPTIAAVSRSALDASLVRSAILRGARFLSHTHAILGQALPTGRILQLTPAGSSPFAVEAGIVLAADGIAGHLLRQEPGAEVTVHDDSRIGIGAWLENEQYKTGSIFMACSRYGYAGIVRTEGHSLDVAAAVDPVFLKRTGGPARAVAKLIHDARLPPIADLEKATWRGTPALSRVRQRCAFPRVFAIGDSAGYVEPFTGDGIAWAMWSAIAVSDLAHRACQSWDDEMIAEWQQLHRNLLRNRQRLCRWIAELLRHQYARRLGMAAVSFAPILAEPIVRLMHRAH